MRQDVPKKIGKVFLELGKWGLVIFLLMPLTKAVSQPVNFTRIVLGILLFVLFSGKMFYDAILRQRRRGQETTAAADLLSILAMAVGLSMIIGLVVLAIGMLVFSMLQEANLPR